MEFVVHLNSKWVVLWSALILWNVQELRSAPSIKARAAEEVDLDAVARASNRDCQGQEAFGGKGGDADAGPGGVGTGGRGGDAKAGPNCVGIGGKGGTGTGGRAAGSDATGGKGQGGRGGDGYGGDYAVGIGGDGGDGIGQPAELGVGGNGGDGIGGKCAKGYGGKGGRGTGKRGKDGKSIDGDMTGCRNTVGDKNRDATGNTGASVDKTAGKMAENKFSGDSEPDARIMNLQNLTLSNSTIQPVRTSTTAEVSSVDEQRRTTDSERLSGRNVSEAIGGAKKTTSGSAATLVNKDDDDEDDEDGFLSAAKKEATEEAAVSVKTQEGQSGTAVSLPVKVENGTSSNSTTEIRAVDGTSALDTSTKDGKPVSMTISGTGEVKVIGQPLNEQSVTASPVASFSNTATIFISSNKTV